MNRKLKELKKCLALCTVFVILFGMLSGCNTKKNDDSELTEITLVLDWTPNTNHTGFYVADKLGYYEDAGIKINIVQPPEDGATALVTSGKAQFGIDFQDYLVPVFTGEEKMPVVAVAALVQHNTSGIVSLKEKGIDSPSKLAGMNYATWDLPIEQAMIKNIVEADNGDYSKINMIPAYVTDICQAFESDIDAVWIYYGWDGIRLKTAGMDTNFIKFTDITPVFDYYSPVIVANEDYLKDNGDIAKKFLEATKKGYEYSIENPEDAANILVEAVPELDKDLIIESQAYMSTQYKADVDAWGYIDKDRWDAFYKWLYDNKLIETPIEEGCGFTNDYLSK